MKDITITVTRNKLQIKNINYCIIANICCLGCTRHTVTCMCSLQGQQSETKSKIECVIARCPQTFGHISYVGGASDIVRMQ